MAQRSIVAIRLALVILLAAASTTAALNMPHDIHDMHEQMQQRMKQHMQEFSKLQRRLSQAPGTASASANARASEGASVRAVSTATGTEQQGSSSDVTAVGTEPNTKINCQQQAAPGQTLEKVCADWVNAPRCTKDESAYELTLDAAVKDRAWGFENNASCAFKDENNKPRAFDKSKAKQPKKL